MNGFDRDFSEKVLESLSRLDEWVEKNGWAGYDPISFK